MNTPGKWLARTGALLVLLGFFLPSMMVSCSGLAAAQSFSLADLAGPGSQSVLYLVLIGAFGALVLSFIVARDRALNYLFVGGQLFSLGVGALSMFFSLISLYNQFQQALSLAGLLEGDVSSLFDYSLEFGFFVLLLGYLLGAVGVVIQFVEAGKSQAPGPVRYGGPPGRVSSPYGPQALPAMGVARLDVVSGSLPRTSIPLADNFLIGRSRDCHLQMPDQHVSRHHASFRWGQGVWFVQDQGSSSGTFVNGAPVRAARLNPGDQIRIGDTTFIFRI